MRVAQQLRKQAGQIVSPVPPKLRAHHGNLDTARREQLKRSIKDNFHTGWRDPSLLSKERYEQEVRGMLDGRLGRYRKTYVPWIDSVRAIAGLNILEIGCGTGAATVALAEQGAQVTAIDIDRGSLQVARDRLAAYGLQADVRALNACELSTLPLRYDLVIYNACLEHMTIEERLLGLTEGAKILASDGLIVIVETPNRLWWDDSHTSKLPMFHSLPDELAYRYAKFSPRENFREIYNEIRDAASREHFLRRGRGMSFHEVDLALGQNVEVVSALGEWEGWRGVARRVRKDGGLRKALKRHSVDTACRRLLRKIYPRMHSGWHQEYLHLVLRQRGTGCQRAPGRN